MKVTNFLKWVLSKKKQTKNKMATLRAVAADFEAETKNFVYLNGDLSAGTPCEACDYMRVYHEDGYCYMFRVKPIVCLKYTRRSQWEEWVFSRRSDVSFTVKPIDLEGLKPAVKTALKVIEGVLRVESSDGPPLTLELYQRHRGVKNPLMLYLRRDWCER